MWADTATGVAGEARGIRTSPVLFLSKQSTTARVQTPVSTAKAWAARRTHDQPVRF
jgi:hypothetical protein